MGVNIFFVRHVWIVAIVLLKKSIINICIFVIIISKLGYKQEFHLVILLEVDKDSEVGFYYAVLSFVLAVNL